jgi:DNA polymerase-1|tara:strand:- start:755 stop:2386 length:1632 start_codon:yes stop_codon:yes gene_type:complete
MKAVVDIETDAINAKKIHCIVAQHYQTGEVRKWVGDECKEFGEWSKKIDQFIMHNGISFDAPLLNKFTGSTITPLQVRDTLLESQLFNPVREGGHSLESWGERLGFAKLDFHDFSEFSPLMLEYCQRDVELTRKLAQNLELEKKKFSNQCYNLERDIRIIVDGQQNNGFAFDLMKAQLLLAKLEDEQHELESNAEEEFEPTIVELKTKTKEIPFNIASRKQIADRLMDRGWEPSKLTDKGNVIVNEDVLSKINMPEAQMFSRYFLLQKRTGLLKAWIKECGEDMRVRGRVLTLKTITGRMAHHSPNMAQVPAVYSPYGQECRELWTVSNPDTHQLVGTDASGLELRCLAHYMNNADFTNEVLTGDVHTANQRAAGLSNRDQAKTFIYAFLYGAGPAKIGKIVGGGPGKGQKLISKFLANMPALRTLRSNIQEAAQQGNIKGLDGRRLMIRSEHAALNTLLQGAGAIVCKQWLVEIDKRVRKSGLDAKLVASVHDEYQFEVAKPDINRFTKITKEAMYQTQKVFSFRCDLDSDYKVGNNWAETH